MFQAAFACLPSLALVPVSPADAEDAIAEVVEAELEAKCFHGAVVMAGTAEGPLYHEAFGYARIVPERAPMRRDSIFDVASVTKVVATATAVGILRDRGLCDPDSAMTRYFPDYKVDP